MLKKIYNIEERKTAIYGALIEKVNFDISEISSEEKIFEYLEIEQGGFYKYSFTTEFNSMIFFDLKESGKMFRFEKYIEKNDEEYVKRVLVVSNEGKTDEYSVSIEEYDELENCTSRSFSCNENLKKLDNKKLEDIKILEKVISL